MNFHPQLAAATDFVSGRWLGQPAFGIILGTGAGRVAQEIATETVLPYRNIPGFPRSSAPGHDGQLVCGQLDGQPVVAMQGRFHLYEGYRTEQIRLPLELMFNLGVRTLLVSNAAGGINPRFVAGDLMVLENHLDLMFQSWSAPHGRGHELRPVNRPDTCYDRKMIASALDFARRNDFDLHRGVYAGLTGPNYETRAEYRFLRHIGADVAGMSTVPEVIIASQIGMRVLAFSMIANVANPDRMLETSARQVINAASLAAPRLCGLMVNALNTVS